MPKEVQQYDLPQEFVNAFQGNIAHLRPVRIGPNRLKFSSPLPEYPGTLTTPMFLSPEDYSKWWELTDEGDVDFEKNNSGHWSFADWKSRFHFVKHWNLKDESTGEQLDTEIITKDGKSLPDMRIITWMLTATQPVLSFSVSIPNLPKPLPDTTKAKSPTAEIQETIQ